MILHLSAKFKTPQDEQELDFCLKKLQSKQEFFLDLSRKADEAKMDGNMDLSRHYENQIAIYSKENFSYFSKYTAIKNAIDDRYIASFNGNLAAILSDIQQVMDAVDKEDIGKHYEQTVVLYKKILSSELQSYVEPPEDGTKWLLKQSKQTKYECCLSFLKSIVSTQLRAIDFYKIDGGQEKALAIIEARAACFYKKPRTRSKQNKNEPQSQEQLTLLPVEESIIIDSTAEFFNLPYSVSVNTIMEIFGAGESLEKLENRKNISHGSSYLVSEKGNRRRITYESNSASITVEISDIDNIDGNNKPAKKLLILTLIKANEQALYKGKLTREYVSFPLQELVDIGFYSSKQNARRGFKEGRTALVDIKIQGERKSGKTEEDRLKVLFTDADIVNGQCMIYLNPRINWGNIAQFFTILPKYYFKLPGKAADLLLYIFSLARQHTKDIQTKGCFNISFRSIQARLQLPSEVDNRRPQQTIRQPIEEAIGNLEDEHSSMYGNTDFQLLPVYDENSNIKDFLDNGYLQITFKGHFQQYFAAISENKVKQIEAAKKKRERITEKAIAAKIANSSDKPVTAE